jgi:hypothetical protein
MGNIIDLTKKMSKVGTAENMFGRTCPPWWIPPCSVGFVRERRGKGNVLGAKSITLCERGTTGNSI